MTEKNNSDASVRVTESNSDQFTDRLKVVIHALGGVASAARTAGVAESTVRKWRDGESDPQRQYMAPLAAAAGVSLAWLVAGEDGKDIQEERALYEAGAPLIIDRLVDSIMVVEEVLDENNLYLRPLKKAQLVAIIYEELLKEESEVEKGKLLNLVKLAV